MIITCRGVVGTSGGTMTSSMSTIRVALRGAQALVTPRRGASDVARAPLCGCGAGALVTRRRARWRVVVAPQGRGGASGGAGSDGLEADIARGRRRVAGWIGLR